jgi:ATP-dependent exoDNAse (exonuclease V) beta subunit
MKSFLIYKSSAGSGKTTALILFFLKLSLRGNSSEFKHILAITFTNKAANEMRHRLIDELVKIINFNGNEGDLSSNPDLFILKELTTELNIGLQELKFRAQRVFDLALRDFGEIGIGTIDRFNHRLIRSFSRELNLKSDFEVTLDEANLFEDVVDLFLTHVGHDDELTQHLIHFIELEEESDRKVNLRKQISDLRELVMGEEGKEALQSIGEIPSGRFLDIRKNIREENQQFEAELRIIAEEFENICQQNQIEPEYFSYKEGGFPKYFKSFFSLEEKRPQLNKNLSSKIESPWVSKSASKNIQAAVEPIQENLRALYYKAEILLEENYSTYAVNRAILSRLDLLAVLRKLSETLSSTLEERNLLPVSYFNRIISDALRLEPVNFIYENLGHRYRHILIDEFQDTSELQWRNLLPLVHESLSNGYFSLVVGDAKQSIYRWRGGKAEQLISLPEIAHEEENPGMATVLSTLAEQHSLLTNYRSRKNIVEFNNTFIGHLADLLTRPDSSYRREYKESLVQRVNDQKTGGYVEVNYLGSKPEDELVISQTIHQIRKARQDGYSYGSMAILLRSTKKIGEPLMKALASEGIPFDTKQSYGLDQSPLVEVVISFLRLSVLQKHSPAAIKAMRALCELYQIPFDPDDFARGDRDTWLDIEVFAQQLNSKFRMSDLNGKTAYDTATYTIRTLIPEKEWKSVFIESLLDNILKKDGLRISPERFLQWWDSIQEKPNLNAPGSQEKVEILTIHKSKGLQYDVCILPEAGWKFNPGKYKLKWFQVNNNHLPYVPIPNNPNKLEEMALFTEAALEREQTEFDQLNLMYVALTRAKQRLYINFSSDSTDLKKPEFCKFDRPIYRSVQHMSTAWKDRVEYQEKENGSFTFKFGQEELNTKEREPKVEGPLRIPKKKVDIPVDERLQIADEDRSEYRDLGILFHQLAGKYRNLQECMRGLNQWLSNGKINRAEFESL